MCGTCNSLSGIYVDGAFIKGVLSAYDSSSTILSSFAGQTVSTELCFIGSWVDDCIPDTQIAEIWLNDVVWVIHIREKETNDHWRKYVSGHPIKRKKFPEKQSIVVFNKSEDSELFENSLTTIKRMFKGVEIFAPTVTNAVDIDGISEICSRTTDKVVVAISKEFLRKIDSQESLHHQVISDTDFGSRFLCKVALGAGHNIIGEGFLLSKCANKLRAYFREDDPNQRAKIDVRGVGFISSQNDSLGEILHTPERWTFAIMSNNENLHLTAVSPAGRPMTIMITNDRKFVDLAMNEYSEGVIWTTNPTIVEASGPTPLMSFLNNKAASLRNLPPNF